MRAHLRRPRDLSDDERAAWCAMQDHQAAYQTPFLSPQHALVADTVMDDVWVLVISDDHGVQASQRRSVVRNCSPDHQLP